MRVVCRVSGLVRSRRGQAMVESMFIVLVLTAVFFAALQLCIMAVDDMVCNEAAFSALRVGIVTPARQLSKTVKETAFILLLPHVNSALSIIPGETKIWHEKIAGKDMRDHGGNVVHKYDINVYYTMRLMFSSLLRPLNRAVLLGGGIPFVERTASARLVKSPDEEFYYKAYPGARPFTRPPEGR